MGMEKAERQSEHQDQRSKERQLAQAGFPIAPAKIKIETGASEMSDRDESV
jgi:hypothetical protein